MMSCCKGKLKNGEPCTYKAKIDGYCNIHVNQKEEEPFPLLDLPNDCLVNILERVSLHDLFQVGKLPLGDKRSVYSYVMNHQEDIFITEVNQLDWYTAGGIKNNIIVSMNITTTITLRKWMHPPETHHCKMRVSDCDNPTNPDKFVEFVIFAPPPEPDENEYVSNTVNIYINSTHTIKTKEPPFYIKTILEVILPQLRRKGYGRWRYIRDRIIHATEKVIASIV